MPGKQRKPAKRSATKPARVAVAPGKSKRGVKKAGKKPAAKPAARKAAARKAPRKAPARKPAPRKTTAKAPPRKAAAKKVPAKKVAPKKAAPKKVAPPKAAPKKAPGKKAAPPKEAPKKAAKAAPPVLAKPPKVAAVKPPRPEPAGKAPKVAKVKPAAAPAAAATEAPAAAVPPIPVPAPGAGGPLLRRRGRKRRDPLDDLLKPDKPKRRPGRPRKRSGLGELIPKRARLRKRIRGRRSGDEEDMDLPVAPRPPAPRDTMSVAEIRADVMARYLRGETPPCPVGCGGMAQVVRVSTGEHATGEVWFECLSCAQRERFEVPAPTSAEREAVYATLDANNEPLCPRHNGRWIQLRRRGRDLVCPECGILIQGR